MLPYGVIPIRRTGGDTPLFFVHEVSGEVDYAPPLTRHIDADIPVYGLVGSRLGETSFRTMYAMAKRLVRIIRAVQPCGPYRIAGWSFGGTLAYEIVTQLLGEDETVEFVGLIDSINFAGIGLQERPIVDYNLVFLDYVLQAMDETDASLRAELETIAKTADFEAFTRTCEEKKLLPHNFSLEDIKNYQIRTTAYSHALYDYHPLPIPIPIYLFRAMDQKDTTLARDAHLGWAQVLPEEQIRVIPVPGTHQSMMLAPQIDVLARSLSDAIRQSVGCLKMSF
jgi:thioesterase domain-containing protein